MGGRILPVDQPHFAKGECDMRAIQKILSTLAVSGVLAGGMVTLSAVTTTTGAEAKTATLTKKLDDEPSRWSRAWSRAFGRAFARARARARAQSANTNGPAHQTVNIILSPDILNPELLAVRDRTAVRDQRDLRDLRDERDVPE
ncbi:hypothetical protein ABZ297_04025 [Nonomuraea sp. NPDC005983]|uniref:hypothetical protein n=1 Tax=Nonomuraea sp. NPDC005983 TaxID=3155595 RepID=UPI0033B1FFDA